MLPRSRADKRPAPASLDLRKLIVGAIVVVFVCYFVLINMLFSFSPEATTAAPASTATVAEAEAQAAAALALAAAAASIAPGATVTPDPKVLDKEQVAVGGRSATKEELQAENERLAQEKEADATAAARSWRRNPERTYVWLDVAIDDVYVGRVTAELYSDLVPKTAENFRVLTTGEKGPDYAFKNSVCHRILTGFIVQCGDFTTGKGYGGRSIYGGKFDDEPNGLRLTHSKRYILQMANSGPNTNGSQFCFMLGPAPHLNGKHVVFGEVVEGFEVVDKMEAAGVARDGIDLQHKVSLIDGGQLLL